MKNHVVGCMCPDCMPNQIDAKYGAEFSNHHWGLQHMHHIVAPIYSNRADYNTDSKSYYDYLARQNAMFTETLVPSINRLLRRDLTVTETKSIKPTKTGSWTGKPCDCGSTGGTHSTSCQCYKFDDVIELKDDVKLSNKTYEFNHGGIKATLNNAISIEGSSATSADSGIFSKDYGGVINSIIDIVNNNTKQAKKHTTLKAGKNIKLSQGTNDNGGIEYTVNASFGGAGETVQVRKLLKNDGSQYGYGDTMELPAENVDYPTIEIDYAVGNSQYSSLIPRNILIRKDICPTLSGNMFDGTNQYANTIYVHLDGNNLKIGVTGMKQTGAQALNIKQGNVFSNSDVTKSMISVQAVYGMHDIKIGS